MRDIPWSDSIVTITRTLMCVNGSTLYWVEPPGSTYVLYLKPIPRAEDNGWTVDKATGSSLHVLRVGSWCYDSSVNIQLKCINSSSRY